MQSLSRVVRGLWARSPAPAAPAMQAHQQQFGRGIRVWVRDGNLEKALSVMERKMRVSGMDRLIKRRTEHHLKNSEKRVLARKFLLHRIRSQELNKKLRAILIKKIRGQ